jgi:hypothetical protein
MLRPMMNALAAVISRGLQVPAVVRITLIFNMRRLERWLAHLPGGRLAVVAFDWSTHGRTGQSATL